MGRRIWTAGGEGGGRGAGNEADPEEVGEGPGRDDVRPVVGGVGGAE